MGQWIWEETSTEVFHSFVIKGPRQGKAILDQFGDRFPLDARASVRHADGTERMVSWADVEGLELQPGESLTLPGNPEAAGPLLYVIERLLGPSGCPWDKQQTALSLLRYLLDESYETAEALVAGDEAAFRDELGDMLLQIVFQAALLDDATFDEVALQQAKKLIMRHPHVFGQKAVDSAGAVVEQWETIKAAHAKPRTATAEWIYPSLVMAQRLAKQGVSPDSVVFSDVLAMLDVYGSRDPGTIGDIIADAGWALAEFARQHHRNAEWDLWEHIASAGTSTGRN